MADRERYPAERAGPKVLYIGGTGRTGSTLLTQFLGQVPGWFPGGELAFLWRYGLAAEGRCSCGRPLPTCPVWAEVIASLEATAGPVDPARMIALRRRCWSVHLPLMALPGVASRLMDRLEEFPAVVEAMYRSIAAVTGCRVIVDSSKEPHYSWILRDRTDLDISFLHLVRDPRAVAHSWRRRRAETGLSGAAQMENRGPARAAVYYDVSNIAAEAIWSRDEAWSDRYRVMRYEDFVADPAASLTRIAEFIGEEVASIPLEGSSFDIAERHMAWGNPNRFTTGTVTIRPDDAWRAGLARWAGLTMTAGSAPVARRYGYPLRRSAPSGPLRVERLRRLQLPAPGVERR